MMDTKQLKKILGTLGLAGLLATANLALPGCEKPPAGEQSSGSGETGAGGASEQHQTPGTTSGSGHSGAGGAGESTSE
jgi:hypothetical protein